jgi:RNA polymerase sigma-70 factor (ECF subfamily)
LKDPCQMAGLGALASAGRDGLRGTGAHNPDPHEVQLLRQIAGGDQGTMAEFYRLNSRVVLAQILLTVGERALGEEILQDTMLAIWRGAGSFRGESRVRSWVIAIARRQARDRLRRLRLRIVDEALLAEQTSPGPDPELVALERAEVAEVANAIRALAPAHREVLGLAFGAGLSLPEVADVLNIPLGTVKSRLIAARGALGRVLNERGADR